MVSGPGSPGVALPSSPLPIPLAGGEQAAMDSELQNIVKGEGMFWKLSGTGCMWKHGCQLVTMSLGLNPESPPFV